VRRMEMEPSTVCKEFARILGSKPGVVNNVCLATRSRTNIHPVVLGRKAESFMFLPQAFSYENMDNEGKALCLGETVILQEEINPFMSKLREHGIIVTAVHNHWLFDNPRLMYMHFETIDEPLSFARKVRDAMTVLVTSTVQIESSLLNYVSGTASLCDQFNRILGGDTHTFEHGVCTVMKSRSNIKPVVLGREGQSFLLTPQMFMFESMTRDGFALCSGETVILTEEITPFVTKLRQHGIIVTAIHNHWLFEDPRLMFMHFESIDQPLSFARKVRDAMTVLITEEIQPA
jgi:hypothetical protein